LVTAVDRCLGHVGGTAIEGTALPPCEVFGLLQTGHGNLRGLGRAENPLALSSDSGLGPLGLVAQNGTRIKRLTCLPSAGWSPRMTDLVAGATVRPAVGVPLGLLIGVVSGITFLLLMDTAFTGRRNVQSVMKIVAQLLAVPFFWFGGPWVTTAVMKSVNLATIFTAYIYSLAVTFLLIVIFPTLNLVINLGKRMGKVSKRA
jgi:hypothetical protein